MNKIFLAHDWYSPKYPLLNNISHGSNIFNLICNQNGIEFFKRVRGYQSIPSIELTDHQYFIYEIMLDHKETNWVKQPDMDLLSTCHMSYSTLHRIRTDKGYLLLNLANESIYNDDMFDRIHAFCIKEDIPFDKVIFQVGNMDADLMYKDYCARKGYTSKTVLHVSSIENFEFKTSYMMNELDNVIQKNTDYTTIEKTFLCLNRNYRTHRTNLLLLFHNYDLLKNSFFSMQAKAIDTGTLWKNSISRHLVEKLNFSEEVIQYLQDSLPLVVDTDDLCNADKLSEIWGNAQEFYNKSLISVITETNFNHSVFNTEKTYMAIANRHPFIMVGSRGTLAGLKRLGYKTFSDFWDESYDNIEDPTARLEAIGDLCYKINNLADDEKKHIFYKTMEITDHNHRLLKGVNDEFFRRTFWHTLRDDIVFGKSI